MVEVYLRHWEECTLRITDRKGTSLLGGDIEISYVARDVGFGTGVFPELRLAHLIPKERGIAGLPAEIISGSYTTYYLHMYKRGEVFHLIRSDDTLSVPHSIASLRFVQRHNTSPWPRGARSQANHRS